MCNNFQLPAWEQSYFRNVVFGDSPSIKFAETKFGTLNGNNQPYGNTGEKRTWYPYSSSSRSFTPGIIIPTGSSSLIMTSLSSTSAPARSINLGFGKLRFQDHYHQIQFNANAVETQYGKKKRI